MWAFVTSKIGLGCVALALVMGVIGVMRVDLAVKTHERDQARADARSAHDGWDTCRGKLTSQDVALAAQSARSTAALDAAAKAQKAVAPLAAHVASQAKALAGIIPKGADRCARWEDADAQVKASLQ